jgi:hypothetical protein
MPTIRRFQMALLKPSHYDDDSCVIRIAADCAQRQIFGSDVAIDVEALSETQTRDGAGSQQVRRRLRLRRSSTREPGAVRSDL